MSLHMKTLRERQQEWLENFLYLNRAKWDDAEYILNRLAKIEAEEFARQEEMNAIAQSYGRKDEDSVR